ncbi:MAG: serine/threonine protein kinase [Deltaproteobacteria bacterium]|nr:serine/threonine protein kinase [Deltaproteobacteria bacterium]
MGVDLSGMLIAGRYRLRRQIGKGGMGTVWVAVQEPLGREVALKLIRPELVHEERVRERFRREAKLVAQLNNPHVVGVIDFGETEAPGGGTTLFIAMELLRGRTLRQRLREGPVSPRESAEVVRQIADALISAHQAGVVHRDLKPDNVMLVESPGRPDTVKLVDFGVAKSLTPEPGASRLTQTGMLVGTPGYLAPEVVLGDPAGPSADLYSVGVMWFEMLARRQPFSALTPMALAMLHLSEPAPKLRALVPSVPEGVAELVDELLRKDPAERPHSAVGLVARVDALLSGGLDATAAPTVMIGEHAAGFDQTQAQVFQTTSDRPASTPAAARQPEVKTATLPPPLRDTRPDPPTQPPTQPTTLRLADVPRGLRLAVFAAGGAVLALAIVAIVLLAAPRSSVEPAPAADVVDAGTAPAHDPTRPVDVRPPTGEPAPEPPLAARPPPERPPAVIAPPMNPPPVIPPAAQPQPARPPPEPYQPRLELDSP